MPFPCPHCHGPLSTAPPSRYCARCFLAVHWTSEGPQPWLPDVKAGETLLRVDFRHERLPGMDTGDISSDGNTRMTPHAFGLGMELRGGGFFEADIPFLRRRDLCARTTFIVYDPSISLQVMLRRDNVGLGCTQYALAVSPARQAACIFRVTSTLAARIATMLVDWQRHPAIGFGHPIECELRAQGATLEARIGGDVLTRVHEPRLGIGCPGVRIEPGGAPVRLVWIGFEVREVVR